MSESTDTWKPRTLTAKQAHTLLWVTQNFTHKIFLLHENVFLFISWNIWDKETNPPSFSLFFWISSSLIQEWYKALCLSTNPHSSITDENLSDPYPPALISHWCTGTDYGYLAWFPRWSPLKHSSKHLSAQFVHKPLYVLYHLLKSFQIPTEELWLTAMRVHLRALQLNKQLRWDVGTH